MILGIDGRLANTDQPAGVGRYCHEVIRALASADGDFELRIYLDQPPRATFPLVSGEIRVLPRQAFWTHRALTAELCRHPPDVFFSPVTQRPRACPCPTLITVHDLAVKLHPASFPWRKRIGMTLKSDDAIRHGSHVIAVSESTARELQEIYGLSHADITVACHGVAEPFLDGAQETRSDVPRFGGCSGPYVLFVGQIQPRKNLVRLIDAFTRTCEACPQLPHDLVLAGSDGWHHESVHRAIAASPLAHRIRRIGYVPDAELPGLFAHADLLALPSLHEGFGLPALEAMAVGTPVLASKGTAVAEVVGDAGVLVDPIDVQDMTAGMRRLLLDRELRESCARLGRVRAESFRWEKTATAILAVANHLATSHTTPPRPH